MEKIIFKEVSYYNKGQYVDTRILYGKDSIVRNVIDIDGVTFQADEVYVTEYSFTEKQLKDFLIKMINLKDFFVPGGPINQTIDTESLFYWLKMNGKVKSPTDEYIMTD